MDWFFIKEMISIMQYAWPIITFSLICAFINYKISERKNFPAYKRTAWALGGFFWPMLSTVFLIGSRPYDENEHW